MSKEKPAHSAETATRELAVVVMLAAKVAAEKVDKGFRMSTNDVAAEVVRRMGWLCDPAVFPRVSSVRAFLSMASKMGAFNDYSLRIQRGVGFARMGKLIKLRPGTALRRAATAHDKVLRKARRAAKG